MFAMFCIANTFRVIYLDLSVVTEILKGNIVNTVGQVREVSGPLLRRSPGSLIGANSGISLLDDRLGSSSCSDRFDKSHHKQSASHWPPSVDVQRS